MNPFEKKKIRAPLRTKLEDRALNISQMANTAKQYSVNEIIEQGPVAIGHIENWRLREAWVRARGLFSQNCGGGGYVEGISKYRNTWGQKQKKSFPAGNRH